MELVQRLVDGQTIDASKRLSYLRYVAMPLVTGDRFHLGARIHGGDPAGDLEVIRNHGWTIEDPFDTVDSPAAYRDFIVRSGAEFACPEAVYRELRTGVSATAASATWRAAGLF